MIQSNAGAAGSRGCHGVSNHQQEKEHIDVLPSACTVLSGTGLSLPRR